MIEGQMISNWFVRTHTQPEIGDEAYDAGAKILSDFFRKELEQYLEPDLMFMGKQIIECCLNNGSLEDYCMLLGGPPFAAEE
jgi:hypothetical protein